MPTELSIVIVSWNVQTLLSACLRSLHALPSFARLGMQVIVVDSASADGTVAMLRAEFPWVECIASSTNLGFTTGNNRGLARCTGRYILLLNPDTRLDGTPADPIAALVAYLDAHPRVGLVGPRLRYGDGRLQPSRRRFPTLAMALWESTLLEWWFPRNRWARRYRMEDVPEDAPQRVDWVTGAAMLVRREVIEQVGGLDERFFMYSEELDWCRRIRAAGWEIAYLPQAEIVHYEGQSSGQVVAARHIRFETSKLLYFHKHHGRWQAALLRAFLLLTYVYQLLEETAKCIIGHKRPLRRARMAAYAGVLRSGLRLPATPARQENTQP